MLYEVASYAIIPLIIGLAVSVAVPFVSKLAVKSGVTGTKDKLSVDDAVNYIKGYQYQQEQLDKQERVKNLMSNPNAFLAIGVASFFFLYQFLKRK
jgi:hypothetical protein